MIAETLYNITMSLSDTATTLEPYVPMSAGKGEDTAMPRVCLADSIENCLIATGYNTEFNLRLHKNQIRVRAARVKDLQRPSLWLPHKVARYVPDAMQNHEYWYMEPLRVTTQVIRINRLEQERAFAWNVLTAHDIRKIVNTFDIVPECACFIGNPRLLYEACMDEYEWIGRYDLIERLDDAIEDIPWSQTWNIKNLQYSVVQNITE